MQFVYVNHSRNPNNRKKNEQLNGIVYTHRWIIQPSSERFCRSHCRRWQKIEKKEESEWKKNTIWTDLLFVDELKDVVDIADHDNLLAYHVFFRREPVTYLKAFIISGALWAHNWRVIQSTRLQLSSVASKN